MRSRMSALVLSLVVILAFAACSKKSETASDNSTAQSNQMATTGTQSSSTMSPSTTPAQQPAPTPAQQAAQTPPPPPPPPPPIVVPAGTSLVVRMGNTINTKTANVGDSFTGTLAHSLSVDGQVAIPAGAGVSGTVVDSKSPGKFKGEGFLSVTLNSVDVRGVPTTIQTSTYAQSVKGKGKRSAVMTGGGAGAGALIGGLAGGGKGALIGGLLGGGAGAAGSAFTGNKELQIPAESVVTFRLSKSITVKRSAKSAMSDQSGQPGPSQ